jgi:hypothetical protein
MTAAPAGGIGAWPAGLPKSGTGRVDVGTETETFASGEALLVVKLAPAASNTDKPAKPLLKCTELHVIAYVKSRPSKLYWHIDDANVPRHAQVARWLCSQALATV